MSFAEVGDEYVLRVARYGSFRVSLEHRTIACEPLPAVPAHTLRHLILNQVWPLALSAERTVLHASAVAAPEGVIVLAGPGGRGKSTLAAALVQVGCALVSDDVVEMEWQDGRWWVHPGYPTLRLWPDATGAVLPRSASAAAVAHYTTKRRIDLRGALPFVTQPLPLAAVYVLQPPSFEPQPDVRPLGPRDAMMAVTAVSLHLDIRDRAALRRSFHDLAAMVDRVPTFALAYQRRLEGLPALAARVLDGVHLALPEGVGPA